MKTVLFTRHADIDTTPLPTLLTPLNAAGRQVAEVVDDEVSVLAGRRVAARFREVEVELGEGGDSLLDPLLDNDFQENRPGRSRSRKPRGRAGNWRAWRTATSTREGLQWWALLRTTWP